MRKKRTIPLGEERYIEQIVQAKQDTKYERILKHV